MTGGYPTDSDCIFCRIVARRNPAVIRHETDCVIAFDDHRPKAPTHILVCPKGHYPTFMETPADILAQINTEIRVIATDLGFEEDGFRLVVNNGCESGQIVYHLHYHFLAGHRLSGF